MTGGGRRQIMAFHCPGDSPDLQSLHLKVLDNSDGTLGPCKVGSVAHEVLQDLCRGYPRITDAFWRETLIDAAIFREWILSIGRRDAFNRMAHLFCEWFTRLRAVGLVRDHACDLPMTQNELGDALCISTVDVNPVLQDLRSRGLMRLPGSTLAILDWEQLRQVGDFDCMYLHLDPEQEPA